MATLFDTKFKPLTTDRRHTGRCSNRNCGFTCSMMVPTKEVPKVRIYLGQRFPYTVREVEYHPSQKRHLCPNGHQLLWRAIEGVYSATRKCDPRCTGAKGHNCECQCGGMNHGKDWAKF